MVMLHAVELKDLLVRCIQKVVFYSVINAADPKLLRNIYEIFPEIFNSRLEMLWFDNALLSTNISDVSCEIENLLVVDIHEQCQWIDHD